MKKIEKGVICIIIGEPAQVHLNGRLVEALHIVGHGFEWLSNGQICSFESDGKFKYWLVKSIGSAFNLKDENGQENYLYEIPFAENFLKPLPDIEEDDETITEHDIETTS